MLLTHFRYSWIFWNLCDIFTIFICNLNEDVYFYTVCDQVRNSHAYWSFRPTNYVYWFRIYQIGYAISDIIVIGHRCLWTGPYTTTSPPSFPILFLYLKKIFNIINNPLYMSQIEKTRIITTLWHFILTLVSLIYKKKALFLLKGKRVAI